MSDGADSGHRGWTGGAYLPRGVRPSWPLRPLEAPGDTGVNFWGLDFCGGGGLSELLVSSSGPSSRGLPTLSVLTLTQGILRSPAQRTGLETACSGIQQAFPLLLPTNAGTYEDPLQLSSFLEQEAAHPLSARAVRPPPRCIFLGLMEHKRLRCTRNGCSILYGCCVFACLSVYVCVWSGAAPVPARWGGFWCWWGLEDTPDKNQC